jgi:N-acetylglucosaminyldiphosphoundecaprenol N-acetyl-beta-D-mannosaminyltransferase
MSRVPHTVALERPPGSDPPSRRIVGTRVHATSYRDATDRIVNWAREGESRYVCVATVHSVMEAHDSALFARAMEEADLVTPDGMPLVWGLRRLSIPGATRVYGPDLTPQVLSAAESAGLPVGFYGATPEVLSALVSRARQRWPDLDVAYAWGPPFRDLTPEEDERTVRAINESGARILFVGLGCPKQELWMARHRARVRAVQVGVGAAFDFLAGTKRQAPPRIQSWGLEWLFRLATEPRRLWRRYLRHNPRFVALFTKQLLLHRGNPGQFAGSKEDT